jgi:hypothetical protein
MDILGPFRKVPEGLTHLLLAVDKFIEWIEVKPLAKIASKQAVDFIQDIIFRFGVPNSIFTNNGTQFIGENSWISVMTITSVWAGPQLPTRVQTGRLNALTP